MNRSTLMYRVVYILWILLCVPCAVAVWHGQRFINAGVATEEAPFATCANVTGLSAGTAYWLDAELAAITGGTASIKSLNIAAFDLL